MPSLARALVFGLTFATCACATIAGIDDFSAPSTLDQRGGRSFDGGSDDEASADGSFKSDALGLQLPDTGDALVSGDSPAHAGCGANAQPCCGAGPACNQGLVCEKGVCGGLPSGCACIDTSCPAGEYCLNGQYCLQPRVVPPGWTACSPSTPPDGTCSFEGHNWCLGGAFAGTCGGSGGNQTTCTSVTTGACGTDYGCKYRLD